jgi:hypothetical protein
LLEGQKPLARLNDGCLATPGTGTVLHTSAKLCQA